MGWFDGELSGSIVNVNQYFLDNSNPYLQPTGTIDQNQFALTTDRTGARLPIHMYRYRSQS